jgi:phosphatidylglycerol lysyltransferase
MNSKSLNEKLGNAFGPRLVSVLVLCHGVFIIVFSLLSQISFRHLRLHNNDLGLYIDLGVGISLIYLSALLQRRKTTAFIATAIAYTFYLGANLEGLTDELAVRRHHMSMIIILRALILPVVILILLFINRKKYVVKSDSQGFRTAFFVSIIILGVTFIYGTLGFHFLGDQGFHHHLSIPAAMHYTVDQFNITTNEPIKAYTHKAKLFADSLSFISIFALLYVLISFVQPLRSIFGDQRNDRQKFTDLLEVQHDSVSEDFFKIWPHDKHYFFDSTGESGLAFHVYRGTALILGGPAGKQARYKQLLSEFQYVCYGNDWRAVIVHADGSLKGLYEELGYNVQKLGEEAVVDLFKFDNETKKDKYFKNIVNRFSKQKYSFEILSPVHHPAVITRLKEISDQWINRGNHVERGYAMGYFSEQYMAMCEIAVARDAAGTIQAFLNLVPAEFDKAEATFDLLRSSNNALGNINDFMLINLCKQLLEQGYTSLNLGLCPLVGIDKDDKKGFVSSLLSFTYANGDRFYSFSGLYRFKNKYQPEWKPRYIVYKGGVRGFSRTMNALMRTMTSTAKHHHIRKN